MTTTAAARAAIEIDKPVDLVRAQFFDLDHAIRQGIHHGATLRWLPAEAPGERRLTQEMKLMTRTHVDVFLIEDGEGGSWIKRFVDGPNRGARFVARFTPLAGLGGAPAAPGEGGEGRATRVELEAHVGPMGFYAGLGKLSQLGLQKVLEKTLEEHRRAIEGYQPGRARGAVKNVIAPWKAPVAAAAQGEGARAVLSNLLEAACVVAVADGTADDAERDVIREVALTLGGLDLDAPALDRMVQGVVSAVADGGIERRCEKIAGRLKALNLGEVGLGVAVLVAQVSHGMDARELEVLRCLAAALGVNDVNLADVIHKVDRGLSGVPR